MKLGGTSVWVLGVNNPPGGSHHPTACLVDGRGELVAVGEEERFSRRKYGMGQQPHHAISWCLDQAGISIGDVGAIAVGWDIKVKTRGQTWTREDRDAYLARTLGDLYGSRNRNLELAFVPHHLAHAESTFRASGWDEAAVLVVDGQGEIECASVFYASRATGVKLLRNWPRTHSLGDLFSAASTTLGFGLLDAGKTMGLAAYGRARGVEPWPFFELTDEDFVPRHLDRVQGIDEHRGLMVGWYNALYAAANETIKIPRGERSRLQENPLAVRVAWSAQSSTEQVMRFLAQQARDLAGVDALCLAGGVALNCSANGLLADPLFVIPTANDAGVAIGAAWHLVAPVEPFTATRPFTPYLGAPVGPTSDWEPEVEQRGFAQQPYDPDEVARRLVAGQIGAIVWGRAEIGPRALCHRSVLALPTFEETRDKVNKVKGREPWRPLSPVFSERLGSSLWEVRPDLMRFMLGAVEVKEELRSDFAATVHIDGTARPQRVRSDSDEPIAAILDAVERQGSPPVLLNTSFNGPAEPIVNSGGQAIASFDKLGLDFVVVNDRLVAR